MGLFKFLEKKSAPQPLNEAFRELLLDASSRAGVRVNHKTVFQLVTAQACMRVIAEDIAQIPFKLYRSRPEGGSDPATDHPLYDLVKTKPNDYQTSFELREQMGLHLALMNNAYVWTNRLRGEIVELLPLEPHSVTPINKGFDTNFQVTFPGESKAINLDRQEIWHVRGPSWNGYEGLDGILLLREAVGLALALERHGSKMFANGATVGGVLSTDANLTKEQRDALRESWQERQSGVDNAYKTAVMWGGMKWSPIGSPNDQAQFLDTRRFQVEEVCRRFKMMPIMVGHSDKTSTYASAEQMFLAHLRNTMGPWLTRIEQSADCNLLTAKERKAGFYHKFSRNAYLTSIAKDRMEFYRGMYGIGALNPNEIRSYEDMNPYQGGSQFRVPLNMEDPNNPVSSQNNGN